MSQSNGARQQRFAPRKGNEEHNVDYEETKLIRLQGNPVDCYPPFRLLFSSGPSSDFLAKVLGVDTTLFICNAKSYFPLFAVTS
jgi:hypothetical protein